MYWWEILFNLIVFSSILRNGANTIIYTLCNTHMHKITITSFRGDSGMMEMQMAFAGNSDSEDEDTKVIRSLF